MQPHKTLLIMAGGTGGHVFPALAVAKEMAKDGWNIHWLGTAAGIESRLVPEAGYPLHCLNIAGVRGNGLARLVGAPFKILRAILQAKKIIKKIKPNAVLGFGGYATGPGGVAAKLSGVPLLIHEQNAVAGLTNKLLSPMANVIMQGFPNTLKNALFVGNPVREEVAQIAAPEVRLHASGKLKVLVVGGSLGAKALNETIFTAMQMLPEEARPELMHQVGKTHFELMQQSYSQAQIAAQVLAFIDDMASSYAWADLVICRAGALTVAEIAAAGCAALFVPFPHAVDDHQSANARYLADQQAALLVQQSALNAEKIIQLWQHYAAQKQELLAMASKARGLAINTATQAVANQVKEVSRG
ncbi:MAG: undecaprenyldiphospho-muramoylpentapeptide beta-N-acetylglucosaminyltransferase [Venatoribacter sp.]